MTAKLLPLIPVSSFPDGYLVFDRPLNEHENQFMGRVDYNLAKQRIYTRYFYSKLPRDAVSGAQDLVRSAGGREFFSQSASFSHPYNASSTLINSAIFSFNYDDGKAISGAPFSMSSIGSNIAGPNPPEINIQVAGYFSISTGAPGDFKRENFHVADALHWIRGSHEFAIGGDFLRMMVDLNNSYRQAGRFRFRGAGYSVRHPLPRYPEPLSGRVRSDAAGPRRPVRETGPRSVVCDRLEARASVELEPYDRASAARRPPHQGRVRRIERHASGLIRTSTPRGIFPARRTSTRICAAPTVISRK